MNRSLVGTLSTPVLVNSVLDQEVHSIENWVNISIPANTFSGEGNLPYVVDAIEQPKFLTKSRTKERVLEFLSDVSDDNIDFFSFESRYYLSKGSNGFEIIDFENPEQPYSIYKDDIPTIRSEATQNLLFRLTKEKIMMFSGNEGIMTLESEYVLEPSLDRTGIFLDFYLIYKLGVPSNVVCLTKCTDQQGRSYFTFVMVPLILKDSKEFGKVEWDRNWQLFTEQNSLVRDKIIYTGKRAFVVANTVDGPRILVSEFTGEPKQILAHSYQDITGGMSLPTDFDITKGGKMYMIRGQKLAIYDCTYEIESHPLQEVYYSDLSEQSSCTSIKALDNNFYLCSSDRLLLMFEVYKAPLPQKRAEYSFPTWQESDDSYITFGSFNASQHVSQLMVGYPPSSIDHFKVTTTGVFSIKLKTRFPLRIKSDFDIQMELMEPPGTPDDTIYFVIGIDNQGLFVFSQNTTLMKSNVTGTNETVERLEDPKQIGYFYSDYVGNIAFLYIRYPFIYFTTKTESSVGSDQSTVYKISVDTYSTNPYVPQLRQAASYSHEHMGGKYYNSFCSFATGDVGVAAVTGQLRLLHTSGGTMLLQETKVMNDEESNGLVMQLYCHEDSAGQKILYVGNDRAMGLRAFMITGAGNAFMPGIYRVLMGQLSVDSIRYRTLENNGRQEEFLFMAVREGQYDNIRFIQPINITHNATDLQTLKPIMLHSPHVTGTVQVRNLRVIDNLLVVCDDADVYIYSTTFPEYRVSDPLEIASNFGRYSVLDYLTSSNFVFVLSSSEIGGLEAYVFGGISLDGYLLPGSCGEHNITLSASDVSGSTFDSFILNVTDTRFSSENCSDYSCGGIAFWNISSCGVYGNCVGYNNCNCSGNFDPAQFCSVCVTGYFDVTCACALVKCADGLLQNVNESCSGRGTCVENKKQRGYFEIRGTCGCYVGYYGETCDIVYCGGYLSNETDLVCGGHGKCLMVKDDYSGMGGCSCNKGYEPPLCKKIPDDVKKKPVEGAKKLSNAELVGIVISIIVVILCCCCICCFLLFLLLGVLFTACLGCVCFVSCFSFCGCGGLWLYLKNSKAPFDDIDKVLKAQLIEDSSHMPTISIDESLFEIKYEHLKIERSIGSGGSGSIIFHAKWKSYDVAFKCFQTTQLFSSQDDFEEFEREVSVMSSIRHPNCLTFYGCTLHVPRVGIVMEYCENGDLKTYLENNRTISVLERIRILREAADGFAYLHERSVIHRDVKCENILLDTNLTAKIIDFGLSKIVRRRDIKNTKLVGTMEYIAPEVVLGNEYDTKCDVFSFSVVIWEVLCIDFSPYKDVIFNVEYKIANDPKFRPDLENIPKDGVFSDKENRKKIQEFLGRMWNREPEKRPSFEEIVEVLKEYENQDED